MRDVKTEQSALTYVCNSPYAAPEAEGFRRGGGRCFFFLGWPQPVDDTEHGLFVRRDLRQHRCITVRGGLPPAEEIDGFDELDAEAQETLKVKRI